MITWLASYPKSGNTWLRIFLTNYLNNQAGPASINALQGGPIASSRIWFDEWVGVEASLLDDALIERLRPEVYRCLVRATPGMIYMKVHDAWRLSDQSEPLFPAEVTSGVIYILRNPLDLAASLANHSGKTLTEVVANLGDPEYALARSLGGLDDQLRQGLGSWSGHVQSWVDDSGLRVLTLRYEDMLAAPEDAFGEVIRFCGLELEQARLLRAIAFSSFNEVKRQEQVQGFRERPVKASGSFFRRGQAGGWRTELAPELAAKIIHDHGKMMRRFGYLEK